MVLIHNFGSINQTNVIYRVWKKKTKCLLHVFFFFCFFFFWKMAWESNYNVLFWGIRERSAKVWCSVIHIGAANYIKLVQNTFALSIILSDETASEKVCLKGLIKSIYSTLAAQRWPSIMSWISDRIIVSQINITVPHCCLPLCWIVYKKQLCCSTRITRCQEKKNNNRWPIVL